LANTSHHAKPAFFQSKNKGCTSGVFLLVLINFFFLQKHKKKYTIDTHKGILQKTTHRKSFDKTIETTGVGDD
jgi:hypothetical protein